MQPARRCPRRRRALMSIGVSVAVSLIFALLTFVPTASAQVAGDIVITEFLTANAAGFVDNTGEREDWIELHNTTNATIFLTNWSLSDASSTHVFSGGVIEPNGHLVVVASGDVSRSIFTEPHVGFKLARTGDELVLRDPSGAISGPAWAPYPPQVVDASYGVDSAGQQSYFDTPSPGAANGVGVAGVASPVQFSVPAGFYDTPQSVVLTTATPSATIQYTTDGSTPSATNGTALAPGQPVTVDETTNLRAVAVRAGWASSTLETRTYLFTADILAQSAAAPPGWPADEAVNSQAMNYGMDPDVVVGNEAAIEAALLALPSISITTDLGHLFDPFDGIYVNALERGWERPASIELIDPSGAEPGFDINAGIRMRGGTSRSPANPKHSFRLFFRGEYEGQLDYPMFGAEGLDNYEKIDLRTSQNYNWGWRPDPEATYIDEVWSRDTQAAMGQPYTRSRQYHLYLNGQYWGLFMSQERVSGDYAERYFGGDDSDYDVVKREAPGVLTEASDGDLSAWQSLYPLVSDGIVSDAEFATIDSQVDIVNLADYYLLHFFSGDQDGAPSFFAKTNGFDWTVANNWYAVRDRSGTGAAGKWQFFDHDSEHSLCAVWPYPAGNTDRENIDNTSPWELRDGLEYFSPPFLHQALVTHPSYRQVFQDRVALHMLTPGGALTVSEGEARLDARIAEITVAIDAESARWGDGPDSADPVLGRPEWNAALARTRACLSQRMPVVESQLRADGLWPVLNAPSIAPASGAYGWAEPITIDAAGQPGDLWITTDGSDPRLVDGTVSPSAFLYAGAGSLAVEGDVTVRVRLLDASGWSALGEALFVLASPPDPPVVVVNELNAVAATAFLGGGAAGDVGNGGDAALGRVAGNGGDWFELVVVEDGTDLRGFGFEVSDGSGLSSTLTLGQDPLLEGLAAGTIVTVSEDLADDVSYFPPGGDWHINLQANAAGDGSYFAVQSGFDITNDDTLITVFDELGRVEALATGESTAPSAGVSSVEVFKLEAAPDAAVTPDSADYDDGTSSTWGTANVFAGGTQTQDLSALRTVYGDANCDGSVNIADALVIAQYTVGLRADVGGCAGGLVGGSGVFVGAGDVNFDAATNIVDSLIIARCEVGLPAPLCPTP